MKRASRRPGPAVDPTSVPRVLRVALLDVWGSRRRYKDVCTTWRARTGAGFDVLPDRGVWQLDQVDEALAARRLARVGVTEDDLDDLHAEARQLVAELLGNSWVDSTALSVPMAPPR